MNVYLDLSVEKFSQFVKYFCSYNNLYHKLGKAIQYFEELFVRINEPNSDSFIDLLKDYSKFRADEDFIHQKLRYIVDDIDYFELMKDDESK